MMMDKLTKLILMAIATALWMIALNPWLRPMPVVALDLGYSDSRNLSDIESHASSIKDDVSSILFYTRAIYKDK